MASRMNCRFVIILSNHSTVSNMSLLSIPEGTKCLGFEGMITSRGNQNRWPLIPMNWFGASVNSQLISVNSFSRTFRQSYLRFVRMVGDNLSTLRILSRISLVIPISRVLDMGFPSRTLPERGKIFSSDDMAATKGLGEYEGSGGGSI